MCDDEGSDGSEYENNIVWDVTLGSIAVGTLVVGTCTAHVAEYGGNKFLGNLSKFLPDHKHHIPGDKIV